MKIKIISDGTSAGTQIIDVETGERLENVSAVFWSMRAPNLAEASLHLFAVPVELVAQKAIVAELVVGVIEEKRKPVSWFRRLLDAWWSPLTGR